MPLVIRLLSVVLTLAFVFQGCDLTNPLRNTPFGKRAPAPAQPQIVTTYPEVNLTDVSVDGPFRVKFDRPMDPASVQTGIAILPDSPQLTVSQGRDASEWLVRPKASLQNDRVYTLQISSSARDTARRDMGRTIEIRFRTAYQSLTRFGKPSWSPDGGFLFVTGSLDGQSWNVWRVPRTGGWMQKVSDGAVPYSEVRVSPDGRQVAFARLNGNGKAAEAWVSGSDGGNARLLASADDLGGPATWRGMWSPGSDRIALELGFGAGAAGQDDVTALVVVATDGTILRRTGAQGRTHRLLGWTRDGGDVIVLRSEGASPVPNQFRNEMVDWDLSTGALTPVQVDSAVVDFLGATQSNDSSAVAVWTWRPVDTGAGTKRVPSELWIYRLGGLAMARLAPTSAGNRNASFAPDGLRVVFESNRTGEWLLWQVPRGGGNPQQLTTGNGADQYPAWSPDGSQIAFISTRSGEESLWLIGSDGSNPRRIAGRW